MNLATFHSWWTVLMFVLFVGIIAWAWSAKRKKSFEQAARMPLEDEDMTPARPTGGKQHG
ncbi:MAG: cbb3-type cytochrome c oxidase subunit 3 [Gammaproteobacteria bacterium]|nr:cbb3-type cytochrome c oxidase subunit 3 [Gammaproteobacteria bacterium]